MRELFQKARVQFLDLGSGIFAAAMNARALDITPDHFLHFARIKGFADVIVSAEAQCFLRRFQRAETGEHDHGKIRIDLANPPQTLNAGRAGHANVHHDGVGMFLAQKPNAGLDAVSRVHGVIRLEQHAQTFARTHLVIDDENLRAFRGDGHRSVPIPACS